MGCGPILATPLIVLAAAVWTRVPEKHWWQVGLTLLLPLAMLAATLVLEVGTMRGFLQNDERRVRFAWGALTLLVWIAVVWLAWFILDWCDDQIPQWASYLNSRASRTPAPGSSLTSTFQPGSAYWSGSSAGLWFRESDSARNRFGTVGKSSAVAKSDARVVELAVVDRRSGCGAGGRIVAELFLPQRAAWNRDPPGVGRDPETGRSYLLAMASWVLLLAWAAALVTRDEHKPKAPGDDALVAVPVGSGPLREDSVSYRCPRATTTLAGTSERNQSRVCARP